MDSRVARVVTRLGGLVPGRSAPAARGRRTPPGRGAQQLVYAPELDGRADPGEIVWTWVPFEDDERRGKDRPVLVVGRSGTTLLALMLSSGRDHDGARNWLALGSGDWDRTGRPSWLRLDRVLRVEEDRVRREGAILDGRRFETVAAALRRDYGWT